MTLALGAPQARAQAPAPAAAALEAAFPGQYAAAPAEWKYPVWPTGCRRFPGEEKACLEFVASDYGRLGRYAAANAALAPRAAGEERVVFFGDSITDNWSKPGYGGFFPGRPYVNRGIGGQTTSQMIVRFRADVIALGPRAVVILAGTNDVAGNSGPTTNETIQDNLASMAELAKAHGIAVVLASILPVSDDKRDASGQALARTVDRPPATAQGAERVARGLRESERPRLSRLLVGHSPTPATSSSRTSTTTASTRAPRATRSWRRSRRRR